MSPAFSYDKGGCSCSRQTCIGCATYEKHKPAVTNADRIRAMTDEELAYLLVHNPWMSEKSAFDWLKEEAKIKDEK